MEYRVNKEFDINNCIPKVLLIGNGLARSSQNPDWRETILRIASGSEMSYGELEKRIDRVKDAPYSVKSTVMLDVADSDRQDKYESYFTNESLYHYDKSYEKIKRLLGIGFDAVLTTNYTYEIEDTIKNNYHRLKNDTKLKYSKCTFSKQETKIDKTRLLRTYNSIDGNDIWHIHGEIRRKSSLVLTHDEYSRLIGDMMNYNKHRGKEYIDYSESLKFKSWIDYFLLGDVYTIGFGFDFSEYDLWWLLNRRQREKAIKGKMYVFNPKNSAPEKDNASVREALKMLGCHVETLDISISKDMKTTNDEYEYFYDRAIEKIDELVRKPVLAP